ncbi:hypothetical protein HGRIS_010395 [Hohenbuehelia grisea]|uniref:Uncharacterized protein n=1 Tax=Hohenbuehelia grisea TaxID=104357 RepID=A0ABR3J473_9AGAR
MTVPPAPEQRPNNRAPGRYSDSDLVASISVFAVAHTVACANSNKPNPLVNASM